MTRWLGEERWGRDANCPNCQRPIEHHTSDERKRCHDALSGYKR